MNEQLKVTESLIAIYNDMVILLRKYPDMTFTIEQSHGETYSNDWSAVYGHDVWGRSSPSMEGQPRRTWVADFFDRRSEITIDPKVFVDNLPDYLKDRVENWTECGGTTHIPLSIRVSHIID
jgi:hypothetical protein